MKPRNESHSIFECEISLLGRSSIVYLVTFDTPFGCFHLTIGGSAKGELLDCSQPIVVPCRPGNFYIHICLFHLFTHLTRLLNRLDSAGLLARIDSGLGGNEAGHVAGRQFRCD